VIKNFAIFSPNIVIVEKSAHWTTPGREDSLARHVGPPIQQRVHVRAENRRTRGEAFVFLTQILGAPLRDRALSAHVADIAQAINACLLKDAPVGVYNVIDDEPAPPEQDFDAANLSPMARSFFWREQARRQCADERRSGCRVRLSHSQGRGYQHTLSNIGIYGCAIIRVNPNLIASSKLGQLVLGGHLG
jgi:hypothetical protein